MLASTLEEMARLVACGTMNSVRNKWLKVSLDFVSCPLQIGGAVTPHDGQCHLRRVTSGGETYYEYDDLRLVRNTSHLLRVLWSVPLFA